MILDEIDDARTIWPEAERYLGVGTRTYSRFSADLDVDEAYHPQRGDASFPVPTFWVPDAAGAVLGNGIASDLRRQYRRDGEFLLPVHPQILPAVADALRGLEPGPALTAIPSANVRTVFVTGPGAPHFLKLHYPRRLSRFTRRLRRPIITVQLWVAAELDRVGVPFLPEVGGGVFGTDPTQAWGYLLREQRLAHAEPTAATIPMFALYGTDVRSPDDPTLLEQLVVRSGLPPADFVIDRVVRPMVRLWVRAATQTGCALEMHGQNTLFGFSLDGKSTVVGYRDCGVYIDPAVRAALGLTGDSRPRQEEPGSGDSRPRQEEPGSGDSRPRQEEPGSGALPPINVVGRDVAFPREHVFSLAYDSFLGHHTLDFLARRAQASFGVPVAALRAAARAEFHAVPEAADLLPRTVHYYDNELHADGGWQLVDTGAAPDWR